MKKRVKKMEERGIEQDRRTRKREYIIILLIILVPVSVVLFGILKDILNQEKEYIIHDGDIKKSIILKDGDEKKALNALGYKDFLISKKVENGKKIDLYVDEPFHASIKSKNTSMTVRFVECTVRELLLEKGFKFDDDDKIIPPLDTRLKDGAKIEIIDVEYKDDEQFEQIAFNVENRENKELLKGKQRIAQYGDYGQKAITYSVRYEDGKEVSREVTDEKIVKEPVSCIIETGTKLPETKQEQQQILSEQESSTTELKQTPPKKFSNKEDPIIRTNNMSTDESELSTAGRANVWSVPAGIQDDTANKIITAGDGSSYEYTSVIDVKATAYNRIEEGGLITATGTVTEYGTIAVDPKVIPLGKKLYVVSNGGQSWSYGPGLAEDTGGLIKGNRIDLFFMTSQESYDFGVRQARVYILKD